MTHDHDAVTDGRRHQRLADPVTLRLHVHLDEVFPPVWRRIEVASGLGLDDLHDVLQVVFAWEDAHLHRFTTGPSGRPESSCSARWPPAPPTMLRPPSPRACPIWAGNRATAIRSTG